MAIRGPRCRIPSAEKKGRARLRVFADTPRKTDCEYENIKEKRKNQKI